MKDEKSMSEHIGFWGALIISALGTMAFFMVYVSALVPESWFGAGFIHDIIVGLVGVFLLDGAAYLWQRTLHNGKPKTQAQMSIATWMSFISLFAAGLMSVSWFLLSMVLVPDGPIVEMAGWLGVIVVIMATFAQFAAWFFYRHYSTSLLSMRMISAKFVADQEAGIAVFLEEAANSRSQSAATLAKAMQGDADDLMSRVKRGAAGKASFASDAPAPEKPANLEKPATKRSSTRRPL